VGKLGIRLALALGAVFVASAAQAQAVRFVRTNGNDANACTVTAPCRTLQRGVAAAPIRGEVRLLDSGDFGAGVTIAKSLTVSGSGATLILSGPVTIAAGAAKVTLENILFTGRGVTQNGVVITDAASVHVVGCKVERFAGSGIVLDEAGAELFVNDSIARNNVGHGLEVLGTSATRLIVDNSRFENNGRSGLFVSATKTSATRSTFSGNGDHGISQSGGTANVSWSNAAHNGINGYSVGGEMQLDSSVARGQQTGIAVLESSDVASISGMIVTNNTIGIDNHGVVRSRQNSSVQSNFINTQGNAFSLVPGI
jgi:hypothetical protein